MSWRGARRSLLLSPLLVLGVLAGAWGQTAPVPGLDKLTPEERALAERNLVRWQKLTPEQRKQRDELELAIARLRQEKSTLNDDEYYRQLEALLTKLGAIELSGGTNAPAPQPDSTAKGLLP